MKSFARNWSGFLRQIWQEISHHLKKPVHSSYTVHHQLFAKICNQAHNFVKDREKSTSPSNALWERPNDSLIKIAHTFVTEITLWVPQFMGLQCPSTQISQGPLVWLHIKIRSCWYHIFPLCFSSFFLPPQLMLFFSQFFFTNFPF